jgi:hypothetical protein
MKAPRSSANRLAAGKNSQQALAKFKKFAAATIKQLESGDRMVVFLHVARGVDPCPKGPPPSGNLYVSFQSQMIKGPPFSVNES